MNEPTPTVSIGLPVYNGENYLAGAIRAILSQSLEDLELIICDNASTDSTQRLCETFATEDPRLRYFRNDVNIGIEPNFNRTFELSRGRYFMWAAHDDLHAPEFLAKCVARLDADPKVVLCHSLVKIIDADDAELAIYDSNLWRTRNGGPAHRFAAAVMTRHLCTDMFGLMRRDALARTRLLRDYYGSDRGLIAEMSLLGRLAQVPEPLFWNREHPARSSRIVARTKSATDDRAGNMPETFPTWALYKQYRRAIDVHVEDDDVRRQCKRLLRKWWFVDWNLARLAVDGIATLFPGISSLVHALKCRIYGTMPQLTRPPGPVPEPPEASGNLPAAGKPSDRAAY